MGTTLTGTTPQDTYDSLIKVTDNGPLSGTAKYLSDGLGNDSALALSTSAVGIGTNSLFGKFNLADGSNARLESTPVADGVAFEVLDSTRANPLDFKIFANDILFNTKVSGSYTERMRIDSAGNVGIGTSSPAQKLDVAGRVKAAGDDYHAFVVDQGSAQLRLERTGTSTGVNYIGSDNRGLVILDSSFGAKAIFTANGLTFNGDTAAANALDDYEEGTWTPATSTSGYTISASSGSYTKIGRQVTIRGQFSFSAINALSSSFVIISGLPFTSASDFSGSLREGTNTGAIYTARVNSGQTNATCNSMDGVATASARIFAINENYDLNVTYFV